MDKGSEYAEGKYRPKPRVIFKYMKSKLSMLEKQAYRKRVTRLCKLAEKYLDFRNRFFSYSSIIQRGYDQLRVAPLMYLGMNLAYRKTTRLLKEHFRGYFNWLRERKGVPTFRSPNVAQILLRNPQSSITG